MNEEKYLEIFREEAEEHLKTLERCILEIEEGKSTDEGIKEGMRAAHTIKGSARLLGLEDIGKVAHAVEDIFKKIEKGEEKIERKVVDMILKGIDAIKNLINRRNVDVEDVVSELRGEVKKPSRDREDDEADREEREKKGEQEKKEKKTEFKEDKPRETRKEVRREFLRIPRERLDKIVEYTGELVAQKMRMEGKIEGYEKIGEQLENEVERYLSSFLTQNQIKPLKEMITTTFYEMIEDLRKTVGELSSIIQEIEVTAVVMRYIPFGTITDELKRMVREMAGEQGKEVTFEVKGGDVELDKADLDKIKPALIHVIRNAIDHGIETPEERRQKGKPEKGLISIVLDVFGEFISISIMDDGRGIDADEVAERAIEAGILNKEDVKSLSKEAKLQLIFEHGISTRKEVTEISGRGVGMDVVKATIEEMRGYVEVESEKEVYTKITMYIPRTSFTVRGIKVIDGDEEVILPVHNTVGIVGVKRDEVLIKEGEMAVEFEGKLIPVKPLSLLLGEKDSFKLPDYFYVAVLKSGDKMFGVKIEDFFSDEDFVIKPPSQLLAGMKLVGGVSISEDGLPLLIINVSDLTESFYKTRPLQVKEEIKKKRHRILLVEDSITTLTIEKNILELAGYEVDTAMDGVEGWNKAQSAEEPYSLFILDIQMPGIDGIELTKKLRETERYQKTPIIIVSSLSELKYKKLAREAGATDFFTKGAFDRANFVKKVEEALSSR